jgi:serine/threonine-protein kinase
MYALVMELVEGPTLADRLAHGPMPVDEALAVAKQIADALEAAHDRGIVHRDLKPANIKVRPDGTVKVLDFGLAKTMEPPGPGSSALWRSPTITAAAMSEAGVILGTAAYMSPEQARGQAVDRRADVWAFGCVLYEMLTGTAAFAGGNVPDVLAAVLQKDPNWDALPPAAAPLKDVLARCLEKDVRRRLRDVGDAALLLDAASAHPPRAAAPSPGSARRGAWATAAIVGLVTGGGAVAVFDAVRAPTVQEPPERFELVSPPGVPLDARVNGQNVAISPDGSTMAYTSDRGGTVGLVVQRFGELEGQRLASTENGLAPIFSPDGTEIAFTTFRELKRVPVAGGPGTTICPVDPYFTGASWGRDGTIVFAAYSFGLFRVPASGGQPEKVASPDVAKQENAFASPFLLPDGLTVLYTVVMSDGSSRIDARRLDRDSVSRVVEDGFGPRYLPSGHLVFARGDRLMAVRFDAETLQVRGSPLAIEAGVLNKTANYFANVAVAGNGTAIYVRGQDVAGSKRLVRVDRHGVHLGTLTEDPVEFPRNLRVSPDGRHVVLTIGPPSNGQIWVYDLSGATQPVKLTFRDHGLFPVWSPDGKRIGFNWRTGSRSQLSWVAADGTSGEPEPFPSSETGLVAPLDWSPDGASLLYQTTTPAARIGVLNLGDGTVHPWLATAFSELGGRLSPNGRWLAYATDQTGSFEIWVRPFPGPGAPVRISSTGGAKPMWSRDGSEIFFEAGPRLLSARVSSEAPEFRAEPPQVVFEGGFNRDDNNLTLRYIDVVADGGFLIVEAEDTASHASIVVAPHWAAELRRLVPDD